MASLKEVKTRIASVNSTRKITSAMKMVASSKLHRAQQAIESMRPYERQLTRIMSTFVGSMEGEVDTAYAAQRDVKRVVIVLFTSNSSLCGGYNANAVKAFVKKVEEYRSHDIEICRVYAMGKKAAEAVGKLKNFDLVDKSALLDHPSYQEAANVASELMDLYVKGDIDEVDLIYHHFKSAGTQILTTETFLPIDLHADSTEEGATNNLNFIVEPSMGDIVNQLISKSLHLRLYTALLDSLASEHAARVIAMQVATDNADDLLRELTLTYNKTRQQAITNELLDIAGGSAAQQ